MNNLRDAGLALPICRHSEELDQLGQIWSMSVFLMSSRTVSITSSDNSILVAKFDVNANLKSSLKSDSALIGDRAFP